MKPKDAVVRDLLLVRDSCLVIPPYQRPYEWNRIRWQGLIRDIADSVTKENKHFIGVAITSESKPDCARAESALMHKHIDIVDGQQRILTLRIWLQAVLDHARDAGEPVLIEFANINCQESDMDDWARVMDDGSWIHSYRNYADVESGLLHAYTYFRWILWLGQEALLQSEADSLPKWKKGLKAPESYEELIALWKVEIERRSKDTFLHDNLQTLRSQQPELDSLIVATTMKLNILVLEIETDKDEDPALIFNALNGQRTEMNQFDHLRNFIFANIKSKDDRQKLYDSTWKQTENEFARKKIGAKGSTPQDTYLYDLMISLGEKRFQKTISKDKTAGHFTRYYNSNRNRLDAKDIAEKLILPNLVSWMSVKTNGAAFYIRSKKYELPDEHQKHLELMEWMSSGPIAPISLNLVNRHFFEGLPEEELLEGLVLIENYLARVVLSGAPLSPLRSNIMSICGSLGRSFTIDSLRAELKVAQPKNADLKRKLLPIKGATEDPYDDFGRIYSNRTPRQIIAIFQGIETFLVGDYRPNLMSTGGDKITVDHIFPQTPTKWWSEIPKKDKYKESMRFRLHTLGNLGLIPKSINSKMSNQTLLIKKDILAKNPFPKLAINSGWQDSSIIEWTPTLIDERADYLLQAFISYWPEIK